MYALTDYVPNRSYSRGDMVVLGGNVYECRVDNVGTPTLDTGILWRKLPTSNKSPQTIQNWSSSVSYSAGDLVTISYSTNIANGNLVYEALVNIPAGQQFQSSSWNMLNDVSVMPNGIVYFSGDNFKQRQWARNDVILRDDGLYVCNNSHTSTSYWSTTDTTKWTLVTRLPLRIYNYVTNKEYIVGDCALYNNKLYVCIEDHVSSATFDSTKWATILYFIPNFIPNIVYYVGVCYFVQIWGEIYLTTVEHTNNGTSDNPNIDLSYNKLIGYALAGSGMNTNSEHHSIGEMTIFNGKLYYCTTPHNIPVGYIDLSKYEKMGIVPLSIFEWRPNVYYRGYYFVIHDGKIYYSKNDVYSDTFNLDDWALAFVPTQWSINTQYLAGQYVWYEGKLYMCRTSHTSTNTFDINFWFELGVYEDVTLEAIEDEVPELKLESGPIQVLEWKPFEHYSTGDYILYNGAIYRVLVDYVSSVFELQLDKIEPVVLDIPAYQDGKDYKIGDLILVDGKIFVCSVNHIGGYTIDLSNWRLYAINGTLLSSINIIGNLEWQQLTDYVKDDVVTHDGKFYKCNTDHTSSSVFGNDASYWECLSNNFSVSDWQPNIYYNVGDIVKLDEDLFICIVPNSDTIFDSSKWQIVVIGNLDEWQLNTSYFVGNLVVYDNKLYRCIVDHVSSSNNFEEDLDKWKLLGEAEPIYEEGSLLKVKIGDVTYTIFVNISITIQDILEISTFVEWQPNTNYSVDTIVLYDDKFYRCIVSHVSSGSFENDPDKWEDLGIEIITKGTFYINDLLNGKLYYIKEWQPNTEYKIGDVVIHNLYL